MRMRFVWLTFYMPVSLIFAASAQPSLRAEASRPASKETLQANAHEEKNLEEWQARMVRPCSKPLGKRMVC
jgi:hypothetical protein